MVSLSGDQVENLFPCVLAACLSSRGKCVWAQVLCRFFNCAFCRFQVKSIVRAFIYSWAVWVFINDMIGQYFLSFCRLSFSFLDPVFRCTKVFSFDEVQLLGFL